MQIFDTLISTDELVGHLDDAGLRVVDCRFSLADTNEGERAYRAGHILGARYAHLDRDLSGLVSEATGRHPLPDPQHLVELFGRWGIDSTTQVVAYDDAGGAFAARLWWLLRWLGHSHVAVLDGGWNRWLEAGYAVSLDVPSDSDPVFQPRAALEYWLAADSVQTGLEDGEMMLVDARAPERFRGDEEPIDPVAGHVPGAINRPYTLNLDDAGRFRPAQELRAAFEALVGDRPASQVVHMCGSGVTACQNLLAMQVAGLGGSSLYAGSWSEWILDPARPVATGPG